MENNENYQVPYGDGEVFEWRINGWGYGWAPTADPEAGLRKVAAQAVQDGGSAFGGAPRRAGSTG